MSSCLILQDKNNFYIGADTACSVNINGKYYRYSDNVNKIFTHGKDVYFCSGNIKFVDEVNSWINKTFNNIGIIDIELLSCFLKEHYPYLNQDAFDVEIVVCRKENDNPIIYQISQYKNYDIITYQPREVGVNIICCGYKTKILYKTSKNFLLQGCNNIKDLYQNVFNTIYDNKVGGTLVLYYNTQQIMNYKIQEKGIEYTNNIGSFHLLIAEAVLSGYIEGSTIKGGTIHIGERPDGKYNFEVNQNGEVTFYGGKSISSNGEEIDLDTYNMTVEVTADRTVFGNNTQNITLICKVYSYGADVTDNYDSSAFRWIRSTGDDESDRIWNEEHYTASSNNVLTITINDISDIAFFSCQVSLPTVKSSNSVAISLNSSDIHIFTSQPNIILLDGRCYHKGDLWVVGSDYQPTGYSQNTILVSTADASEYADGHWVESVYYSTTFAEINSWKSDMQEYVQILDDGLHLIGPASDGVSFESLLQSRKLTFRLNNGGVANDIVWLGVDDMTAKNVTVLNYLNVKSDSSALPYIKLGDFTLQIEENGSLSIT